MRAASMLTLASTLAPEVNLLGVALQRVDQELMEVDAS